MTLASAFVEVVAMSRQDAIGDQKRKLRQMPLAITAFWWTRCPGRWLLLPPPLPQPRRRSFSAWTVERERLELRSVLREVAGRNISWCGEENAAVASDCLLTHEGCAAHSASPPFQRPRPKHVQGTGASEASTRFVPPEPYPVSSDPPLQVVARVRPSASVLSSSGPSPSGPSPSDSSSSDQLSSSNSPFSGLSTRTPPS